MFVAGAEAPVFAADEDSTCHAPGRRLPEGWRAQPSAWFLTWEILYEFLLLEPLDPMA